MKPSSQAMRMCRRVAAAGEWCCGPFTMPFIMNNAHHDGLMTPGGPVLDRVGPSNMHIALSERP